MGQYNDNLYGTAYDKKQNTNVAAVETKLNGLLTVGTDAPSAKPTAKGLMVFNSSTGKLYISKGTTDASDWVGVVSAT